MTQSMKDYPILITGSEGLIGKYLKSELRKLGANIISVDNDLPNTHADYGDICDAEHLTKLAQPVKGIVHLAAVSRVIWGEKFPDKCKLVNVTGTENVLKAAHDSEQKPWVLYASSREVYGQQSTLPVSETATFKPCNHYAYSKVAAEKAVTDYKELGLDTAIMRFSNVYGSVDDHHDRVLPAFCKSAVIGKQLYLEGEHNVFDFTAVEDVVRGIILNIEHLKEGECLPPIHLTTGVGTTLGEAAAIAMNATKTSSTVEHRAPRNYDVATFIGSTDRARELLGWEAKILPATGIPKLVADYAEELKLIQA